LSCFPFFNSLKKYNPLTNLSVGAYAMAAIDANGDGKKDIVAAGNNIWSRIKFGRYSANHGMVFTGDGKGNFAYAPQYTSGLNISGAVRSLQAIETSKKMQLIFGLNNAPVQVYKVNK
jgi:enediyne biosynthesis protein E4